MNKNFIPFSIEAAKNGAKIVTRLGFPVKFLTVTTDGNVFATILHGPLYARNAEKFCLDGHKFPGTDHYNDLFIVD